MRLGWLHTVLTNAGCDTIGVDGWQTRGADTMTPRGAVIHHTAEAAGTRPEAEATFLVRGRRDLAGPLTNLYLDRQGIWWVIAAGRANHAGKGSWRGVTGNSNMIGVECANTGLGEEWPSRQLTSLTAGLTALTAHMDVSADMICGHKEWAPGRKIDPAGVDMNAVRADVHSRLHAPVPDELSSAEVAKLRALIASWEKVGSNATFPEYLIPWFRGLQR